MLSLAETDLKRSLLLVLMRKITRMKNFILQNAIKKKGGGSTYKTL